MLPPEIYFQSKPYNKGKSPILKIYKLQLDTVATKKSKLRKPKNHFFGKIKSKIGQNQMF